MAMSMEGRTSPDVPTRKPWTYTEGGERYKEGESGWHAAYSKRDTFVPRTYKKAPDPADPSKSVWPEDILKTRYRVPIETTDEINHGNDLSRKMNKAKLRRIKNIAKGFCIVLFSLCIGLCGELFRRFAPDKEHWVFSSQGKFLTTLAIYLIGGLIIVCLIEIFWTYKYQWQKSDEDSYTCCGKIKYRKWQLKYHYSEEEEVEFGKMEKEDVVKNQGEENEVILQGEWSNPFDTYRPYRPPEV